jgi:hypothetical protein
MSGEATQVCDHCGVVQHVEDIGYLMIEDKMVCLERRDCRTRQNIKKIFEISDRRKMAKNDEAVRASYNPDYYHTKAKDLVVRDFNKTYGET